MIINENNLGHYVIPKEVFGGVCVDIGANVGGFLKTNHEVFKIIHAYEPIKILADKIQNYNLLNVIIYNEAVADNFGETDIILHKNNESGSSSLKKTIENVILLNDWSQKTINAVKTINLEEVIERTKTNIIDYMKVDCENSEYLIFMNKDLSKIKYIAIELHNQMGKENWDNLKNWVSLTHNGFPEYNGDNQEVLLSLKNNI